MSRVTVALGYCRSSCLAPPELCLLTPSPQPIGGGGGATAGASSASSEPAGYRDAAFAAVDGHGGFNRLFAMALRVLHLVRERRLVVVPRRQRR